jgi:outer membrane lipoprotein-sorting protein
VKEWPFGTRYILLLGSFAGCALGQTADEYLQLAARTYKELRSLQVEAEVQRTSSVGPTLTAFVTVYAVPPHKARIEAKDGTGTLQSLLISNGKSVAEYRPRTNEYTMLPVSTLAVSFTPERGAGWGEMLYDTIADGVRKVSIRDQQIIEVGQDRIPCVIVDVDYALPTVRYSFWIAINNGLVLRRVATIRANGTTYAIISTVRALTMNETLPAAVFEFSPAAERQREGSRF